MKRRIILSYGCLMSLCAVAMAQVATTPPVIPVTHKNKNSTATSHDVSLLQAGTAVMNGNTGAGVAAASNNSIPAVVYVGGAGLHGGRMAGVLTIPYNTGSGAVTAGQTMNIVGTTGQVVAIVNTAVSTNFVAQPGGDALFSQGNTNGTATIVGGHAIFSKTSTTASPGPVAVQSYMQQSVHNGTLSSTTTAALVNKGVSPQTVVQDLAVGAGISTTDLATSVMSKATPSSLTYTQAGAVAALNVVAGSGAEVTHYNPTAIATSADKTNKVTGILTITNPNGTATTIGLKDYINVLAASGLLDRHMVSSLTAAPLNVPTASITKILSESGMPPAKINAVVTR